MDGTDHTLHWVLEDTDDYAVCSASVEGKSRTTNMEMDDGEPTCSSCYTLWTRYTLRMA